MDKLKCSMCENEKLKGTENYCPICGLKLKITAPKVPIKEQLTRTELECLYRHLKMFIQVVWDEKENVPDACIGCNHYCSNNECVFDPWPTFYKIAELAENIK